MCGRQRERREEQRRKGSHARLAGARRRPLIRGVRVRQPPHPLTFRPRAGPSRGAVRRRQGQGVHAPGRPHRPPCPPPQEGTRNLRESQVRIFLLLPSYECGHQSMCTNSSEDIFTLHSTARVVGAGQGRASVLFDEMLLLEW